MTYNKLPGAGKSSFDLVDHTLVFSELGLTRSKVFLDLGCGKGDYIIPAAEIIGPEGIAYGIDGWDDGIEILKKRAQEKRLNNVQAFVLSVADRLPLSDKTVDICFIATALHDFIRHGTADSALQEVSRVLKPRGILGIIEFKKVEGPPGPPIHIRLSPAELDKLVTNFDFKKRKTLDVGPHTYMMVASKTPSTGNTDFTYQ